MQDISNEKFVLRIIKYAPLIFILIASILTTAYISLDYINTLEPLADYKKQPVI
mgnify:CR=1 FL=1